jgi:hypothetical protein
VEPVIELATTFLAQVNRDEQAYVDYGPNFYKDPRAIEIARIIETQLGISKVQILGGGSFGTAAATADRGGEVLKLTSDLSEVEAATVLSNVPQDRYPKNVVRITGAWFLRKIKIVALKAFGPGEEETTAPVRVGLIRMERVRPLEDREAARGLATWTYFVKTQFKVWPIELRHLSKAKQRQRMLAAGQELERMLMKLWQREARQVARDVAQGIAQLRAEGIYGTDFHGGNVGYAFSNEPAPGAAIYHLPTVPLRENPLFEESMQYRGVRFDLITITRDGVATYYVRLLDGNSVSFDDREQAIQYAHNRIDETYREESHESRIYKLFDVGQSSIPTTSPHPQQIPAPARQQRSRRREHEQLSLPIVGEKVKVAELG